MSWVSAFENMPERPAAGPRLPEGDYAARITVARFAPTRAGKPRISWKVSCPEGEAWFGHNLPDETTSQGAKYYMKRTLDNLGITPAMLDQGEKQAAESALGQVWHVAVEQDGEWLNVTLIEELPRDSVLGSLDAPAPPEPAEPPEDPDSEPFGLDEPRAPWDPPPV